MADLVTLDGVDWQRFIESYWERQPVLFRSVRPAPFVEDEVFAGTVCAQNGASDDTMSPCTRLTIERVQQTAHRGLAPTQGDGSFDGYERRMAARIEGRRYALVVNGLHAYDHPMWSRERQFFAPLWGRVGVPLTGAITTLFHGTYEHSPAGVHKDRFSSFMYGLRGRKRMRFWPHRPWRQPVTTVVDYAEHLADSFAAEVGPGDLLYWPSGYYHVGESVGAEPATTVNVGMPREEHRVGYELDALFAGLDPATLTEGGTAHLPTVDAPLFAPGADPDGLLAPDLPASFEQALAVVREAGSGERLTAVSLRRWTSGGFEPVPPPAPGCTFSDDDVIRGNGIEFSGEVCAVNGHTAHVPADRGTLHLLRSGQVLRVGDLPATARPLLEWLESVRGVSRL